jgi:hypothetical protein
MPFAGNDDGDVFHAFYEIFEIMYSINGRYQCLYFTKAKNLKSYLEPGALVPIGWIAVGNPARLFSPSQHEEIWKIQEPLNFPLTVYGFDRPEATMKKITRRLAENLGSHVEDTIITEGQSRN